MTLLRNQSAAIRGIAILMIVLHNVTHFLSPAKTNEFAFYQDRLDFYLTHWTVDPITYFFSFYGWIGVAFFVFISGYGLTAKYGRAEFNPLRWILKHYLKLVFLLMPALIVLFSFEGKTIIGDSWKAIAYYYFLEQFMILNILDPELIWPGIYWYLGMALQLYIIFVFIRRLPSRYLLLLVSLACIFMAFTSLEMVRYLRHNFIGWLPEFIFGILCFRLKGSGNILPVTGKSMLIRVLCIVTLAGIFIVVSLTRYTFFLGGVAFVAFLLCFKGWISKLLVFKHLGEISAALYITHAFVRHIWLTHFELSKGLSPMTNALIVLCLAIILAIPYEYYYRHISSRLERRQQS